MTSATRMRSGRAAWPPSRGAPPQGGAHAREAGALALALGTDPRVGLSEAEARDRLAEFGPNRLARPERPDYLRLAARQIADPLVVLLVAAAAVSAGIGEVVEAAVIAAIVVLNGVLGFVQESGAERALVALREEFTHTAWAVRSGRERELPVDELVPGDLVVLREGDRVPADARLLEAERLAITEAALTGESLPVEKSPAPAPAEAPLADRVSMAYAATAVTRGRGTAVVTATGPDTEVGRIAALTERAERPQTPLQRRLGALARLLVVVGVAITVVLAALLVARGEPAREAFLVGVSVAVAAVPEGLAATVTIALALGAHAMAQRGAIVRRLAAVETFGRTTAVCTDKTGTLTENRLALDLAVPVPGRTARDVVLAGALASSATLVEDEDGALLGVGDPVDAALVLAAGEQGPADGDPVAVGRMVAEHPFDPATKRMAIVYETAAGRRAFVKGAPEVILGGAEDAGLLARAHDLAGEGLKVLAVAEGTGPDDGLEPVGLVALRDPLRPAARPSIRAARRAGIDVRMLTGDHVATAETIGRELGLPSEAIHARVTPEEKLRIVEGLQDEGETVAVTGDGVNDTPALRRADVGVAMGRSGTEAAREAADIVLTDDDFATIVAAVEEGRRITDNVRKVVAFLLSANLGEVLLFAAAIGAGLGIPMTVVQVLVVNVLTDGLPALALTRDPLAPGAMARGPDRSRHLFDLPLAAALAGVGALVGAVALATFVLADAFAPEAAQTMTFAVVALAELLAVFSFRSLEGAAWRMPANRYLLGAVAASAAVVALAVWLPGAGSVLGTVRLGAAETALVLALAAVPALVLEAAKAVARRRRSRPR